MPIETEPALNTVQAKEVLALGEKHGLTAYEEELAGNAHVSFEGDLRKLPLMGMPGASNEPTAILKRNTLAQVQDFAVVPLEKSAGEKIIAAIGGTVPKAIIHIQIEKDLSVSCVLGHLPWTDPSLRERR